MARLRRIHVRRTIAGPARHAVAPDVSRDAVIQVVSDEEVQPSVSIDVHEGRRDAPSGARGATLLRHVGERAVTVVAEQLVRSEVGDVEIDAAIVVEIAGRHAHAISARVDPAPGGHVGESQRAAAVGVNLQIVPKQAASQRRGITRREQRIGERLFSQHLSLDDEDVEVAVVVVVEERDAGRHDFGVIELAGHAVEMREGQPGWRSGVGKPGLVVRRWSLAPGRCALATATRERGERQRGRRRPRPSHHFTDGLPNFVASIATFVSILFSLAVYRPSSHMNLYSNGNLMPPTSR